jgi:cytochrome c oxidase cbb3-type subunit 4
MDYGFVQGALTLVLMGVFVGIGAWAWHGRQRARFEAAAQLPFQEDDEKHPGVRR